ncbi:Heme oxygenase [Tritonibacter multivorans]|uniref:Heme oxygenase n=1 Tax=Tritonibacter multivorans TaxID=928856 RepID=A0A0P1G6L5_9RHOB|nr:biliverdin-producing heme oxygenase [Tritonibacter multivorans]MDA7422776.1 biliverdin-producing heme oxygenase [Tritonibacter multivorans]CUH77371.1 Heme oxygenase [Tritonibacter multivorans]SFD60288.1 Heme oxygenase [Tritonibacter multivorans]
MSIRQELKARSRARHEDTEALFWGDAGFADAQAYARYLRAMAHVHGSLGLAAAALRGDLAETRHHRDALVALSRDLGQALPAVSPRSLASESEAWGVSYALLGSCLGAQVLSRSLSTLPWGAAAATTYLAHAGGFAKSGALKQFFGALDAAAPDAEQATQGAHLVFDTLSEAALAGRAAAKTGEMAQ